jgi:hypothetical protein
MRTACVLVGLLIAPACTEVPSLSQRESDVIGGQITPEGEFPGVGSLYLMAPDLCGAPGCSTCTGTLIAPDVVLTAGHCLDPIFLDQDGDGQLSSDEIPGFTLAHDTVSSQPQVTPGASTLVHPSFDLSAPSEFGQWFDIALLFLAQPITSVPPILLPSVADGESLASGMQLELVGYGRTSNDTDETGVMFDAVTDLVTRGTHELQISTPGAPQNCHGDSGGPALKDFGGGRRVVGVVSRSANGTGECTGGGIDTRVDAYLTWIDASAPTVCIPGECAPDAAPPPPDGGAGADGDGGGCCSSSRDAATASALLAFVVGLMLVRRRRA